MTKKEDIKKFFSEKERYLIANLGIYLGNAKPTKTPNEEEAINLFHNIIDDSLSERKFNSMKTIYIIVLIVVLFFVGLLGWYIGKNYSCS